MTELLPCSFQPYLQQDQASSGDDNVGDMRNIVLGKGTISEQRERVGLCSLYEVSKVDITARFVRKTARAMFSLVKLSHAMFERIDTFFRTKSRVLKLRTKKYTYRYLDTVHSSE